MTLSPTATSSGTRLPLSSMRPGPTATTSPSCGFSLAVSGMTRPEAVTCSASTCLMTMRSSSGLMETDTWHLFLKTLGLAHSRRECQDNYRPGLALIHSDCQLLRAGTVRNMTPEELRALLTPEGLRLLDEVGEISADADVV